MIEAVIFDLDGTLIKLPMKYGKLFREVKRIMNVENVRPLLKTVAKADEEQKKRIFKLWDEIEAEALPEATQNKEGIDLFNQFKQAPRILVTMQGKATTKKILKRFNISFETIITRENSVNRAEQLRIALSKFKIQPQNILFVGNEDHDKAAAEQVGCQFQRVKK